MFCDGCNGPWHQYCHDPPVRTEALADAEREWFCADCVLLREHSAVLDGKVAGEGMSVVDVSSLRLQQETPLKERPLMDN